MVSRVYVLRQIVEHSREEFKEAVAFAFVFRREQFLALVDGKQRGRRAGVGDAGTARLCCQCRCLGQKPAKHGDGFRPVRLHQTRFDIARRLFAPVAFEPRRDPAADAVGAGQEPLRGAQDGQRREIRVALEPRPEARAQETRFARAGRRLDDEQARGPPLPHQPELREAGGNVGLASEENARVVFAESGKAGIGALEFVLGGPREAAGRNAEIVEPGADGGQRGGAEVQLVHLALVLDGRHALSWLRAQIDYLDFFVFIAAEPRVVDGQIPDDNRDDLLFEDIGELQLFLAFLAVERLGRGQQQHRLTRRIGLAEFRAPAGTRPQVVQIDEYVGFSPAIGNEPFAEGQSDSIVLA